MSLSPTTKTLAPALFATFLSACVVTGAQAGTADFSYGDVKLKHITENGSCAVKPKGSRKSNGAVQVAVYYGTDKCRTTGDHNITVKSALNDPSLRGKQVFAQVCGSTDERASDSYNDKLGLGRAKALARVLSGAGVSVQTVESDGEESTTGRGNVPGDRDAVAWLYTDPTQISHDGCDTEWKVRHTDYFGEYHND